MKAPSYWLRAVGWDGATRAPLVGDREADVCVVGGGYTGLWTALELKRADPALEVVVLEAEGVGFGASGRNGGWVLGELAPAWEAWAQRASGRDGVLALDRAIRETVDEVGAAVEREGIDCDWVKGGSLHVAQTPLQLSRVQAMVAEEQERLGRSEDVVRVLSAAETAERVRVAGALGARAIDHCARVQPAKLVLGLGAAAERAGVVIHEGTRVERIEPGAAVTAGGTVRARFVVRATEGYTAGLPGSHRTLVPLTSSMIVTDPLDAPAWEQIGWDGMETMTDAQHRYVYLQRTADGRIAIGGRGVPYRWGSNTDREGPLPAVTARALRDRLVELFPGLQGVGINAGWHGVLGVARDWAPAVGLDRGTGLAWAGGYVGEGVAAANLAGRTLRDLILGEDTALTRLPWVGPFARDWEPEPLRWAGVCGVYALYKAADERERATNRPAVTAKLADLVAGR